MNPRFALIGENIAYSRSPQIHTRLFEILGKVATYELFDHSTVTKADLKQFSGANVTIPHKERILEFVDYSDCHVQAIGAANTLVWEAGKLCAYNTDWIGFLASIEQPDWQSKRILLIGAGGAAKAVYYALQQLSTNLSIANRTRSKCEFVDSHTKRLTLTQARVQIADFDYVVQATNQDFPWLTHARFVYDLRYTTTHCHQNGLKMLIHQAIAAQSYFWQQAVCVDETIITEIERKLNYELNWKTSAFFTLKSPNN